MKKLLKTFSFVILSVALSLLLISCDIESPSNSNSNQTSTQTCSHQWISANCTTPQTCSLCGTIEGKPLGHNYIETVVAPSCIKDGYTSYSCACGENYTDNKIAATDHIWSKWITTKEATEKTEGEQERTCATCGEKETKSIAVIAHTHNYSEKVTKPTCTNIGYTTYTCTCGHTYQNNIVSAIGHKYNIEVIEPTCTERGYTAYICHCGADYKNYIPAKGHTEVIDKAVVATTTSTGLTEGSHCSVCGIILIEQIIIPKIISPSENSTFEVKKNDILRTYTSLYNYNEYSIDYVGIEKSDISDSKFKITVTIGAVLLTPSEDAPNFIKGYWELVKDGETVEWDIFTISHIYELEYTEITFTCKNLEEGDYKIVFTSYI